MGQITIFLDNEIENKMKDAAKARRLSVSKWISNLISEKIATEWPQEIVNLAGCWKNDFPSLDDIRATEICDVKREEL